MSQQKPKSDALPKLPPKPKANSAAPRSSQTPRASVPMATGPMFGRPIAASQVQRERRAAARSNAPTGTVTAKVASASEGEILLYGTIGADWFGEGITDVSFNDALQSLGDVETIRVRINSGGGDVFMATAMYNMLVKHGAYIIGEVEGSCCSAATFFLQAADERRIAENAHFMIHQASGVAWGNADQVEHYVRLLRNADELIRLTYAARSGISDAELADMMDHDNWMTAQEAFDLGFVDVLDDLKTVKPHVSPEDSAAANAANSKHPFTVTPERLAAMSGHLLTLAASVRPGSFTQPTGSSPARTHSTKDQAMKLNAKLRAKCVAAGMSDKLNDEDASKWFDEHADAVLDAKSAPKVATARPLRNETREDYMTRCMEEGGDEGSCSTKWDESGTEGNAGANGASKNGNAAALTAEQIESLFDKRDKDRIANRKKWRKEVDDTLALVFDSAPTTLRDECYDLQDDGIEAVRAKVLKTRKEADEKVSLGGPRLNFKDVQPSDRHISAIRTGLLHSCLKNLAPPEGAKTTQAQLVEKYLPAKDRPAGWEDFSQMPLLKIAEECLMAEGMQYERVRTLTPMQTALAALGFHRQANLRADAALHTTGSLAEITRDAVNKSVLAGYQEAPVTWRTVFRQGESSNDFKEIHRVQLGGVPNIPIWVDNTNPEQAKLANEREHYAVEARALMISFSWKLIVNDDKSALSRTPQLFGDSASRTVNAVAWQQITSNPTMADGQALFLATPAGNRMRANLITGSATPTNSTIGSMRKLMRLMRGLNTPEQAESEDILNLEPSFIWGPAALEEVILKQVMSSADPASGGNSGVYNTARTLTPVIEPLLDAASSTAFYLSASTARVDTVEVTFLTGQEVPYTHEDVNPKTLCQDFTIIQTYNAKALNHRGLIRHDGA